MRSRWVERGGPFHHALCVSVSSAAVAGGAAAPRRPRVPARPRPPHPGANPWGRGEGCRRIGGRKGAVWPPDGWAPAGDLEGLIGQLHAATTPNRGSTTTTTASDSGRPGPARLSSSPPLEEWVVCVRTQCADVDDISSPLAQLASIEVVTHRICFSVVVQSFWEQANNAPFANNWKRHPFVSTVRHYQPGPRGRSPSVVSALSSRCLGKIGRKVPPARKWWGPGFFLRSVAPP